LDAFLFLCIARVNKKKLIIEEVVQLNKIDIADLVEELPESSPRFVVLAYAFKNTDGRMSFPLILINWAPTGCETGLLTLHASAFIPFQQMADANKTFEVRDGAEGLTKDLIDASLRVA